MSRTHDRCKKKKVMKKYNKHTHKLSKKNNAAPSTVVSEHYSWCNLHRLHPFDLVVHMRYFWPLAQSLVQILP